MKDRLKSCWHLLTSDSYILLSTKGYRSSINRRLGYHFLDFAEHDLDVLRRGFDKKAREYDDGE